jgi:hypothetical protein
MAAAMGVIGIGASLAGGILGAEGAKQSAAATQQMYNYQAGVAQINSKIDLQNADFARNQGEVQATQFGLKERQQEGAIKVAQSASNLDVNSGSAIDVQTSQRKLGQMDLTQIRSNAAKTAYDFDVKSTMDLNQSTLDITAGTNAIAAGNIQAMSSIIGSVGSVSSKWMQGSQAGMFPSMTG